MAFECPRRSSPPSPMFDADTGCIATDPAPSARRRFRSKTGIENLPANEHAQETPHTPSPTRTTRRIQSGCAGSRPRLRDGMPSRERSGYPIPRICRVRKPNSSSALKAMLVTHLASVKRRKGALAMRVRAATAQSRQATRLYPPGRPHQRGRRQPTVRHPRSARRNTRPAMRRRHRSARPHQGHNPLRMVARRMNHRESV